MKKFFSVLIITIFSLTVPLSSFNSLTAQDEIGFEKSTSDFSEGSKEGFYRIVNIFFITGLAFYIIRVINELRKGGDRGMEFLVKWFIALIVYLVLKLYFKF